MAILKTTERLTIKSWAEEDLSHYLIMMKDVGFNCFSIPGYFWVNSTEEALGKIRERMSLFETRGLGKFLVLSKATGELMGTCGIAPYLVNGKEELELGYRYLLKHWGFGFASEAAQAVLEYGFERLDVPRILALVAPQNKQSIRVIEKLDMQRVGEIIHYDLPHLLYEMKRR